MRYKNLLFLVEEDCNRINQRSAGNDFYIIHCDYSKNIT